MIQPFWKPRKVARELGITAHEARALMRSGAIASTLYASTKDGREYYRTTAAAVVAYQRREIPCTPEPDYTAGQRNYPIIHVQ